MAGRPKIIEGSDNIFWDLGFSEDEAENLKLRAALMSEVRDLAAGRTQQATADLFGITQPRLNDLLRGKIGKFSVDALVKMLGKAGMRVKLTVRKAA